MTITQCQISSAICLLALSLLAFQARAQSIPNPPSGCTGGTITQGQVWTIAQWNAAWPCKADVASGVLTTPTITSPLITGSMTVSQFIGTNTFTYGYGAGAVGNSQVTNSSHIPQVMGTFGTKGVIGSYAERDSIGEYWDNTAPALLASVAGTFSGSNPGTFTPTTPISSTISASLATKMIIDTNDATKYSGIITGWTLNGSGQATAITVDAWVQTGQAACGTNPGLGTGCVAGTPSGTTAYINPVTKVFGGNSVATIASTSYATAAAVHEFDLNDTSSNQATNVTWGVDVNNLQAANGRVAHIARGYWDQGFDCATTNSTYCFIVAAGASPSAGFYSAQTTGNVFQDTATMTSGNYIRTTMFNVSYLGQTDIGSQVSASTSPLVLHASGHAGGDANLTVTGGTGVTDGALVLNGATVALGSALVATPSSGIVALGGPLYPDVTTVGSLPSCNTARKGYIYEVSDANAPSYNATLAGSGSSYALAICNGTNWTAH